MKVELEKILQVRFIQLVKIINWISHMVLIKKKNKKNILIYIDNKKCNKYIQKVHFSFYFINTILEDVTKYKLYIFINGNLEYN